MFHIFKEDVKRILDAALLKEGIKVEAQYTIPMIDDFGELSTNISFQLTKHFKKSPNDIAVFLLSTMKPTGLVKDIKAVNGYLNFYMDHERLAELLLGGVDADFGRGEDRGERIILEHTSANPDGPLHIGHLRNAVIGDTLARILRFSGYDVEVHYYLNDMGKQAAKVVWGRRNLNIKENLKKDLATAKVYVEANKLIEEKGLEEELSHILTQYESRDEDVVREFVEAVEYCLEGIEETLSRLGIKHDRFLWESTFVRDGTVDKVIDKLANSEYAKRDGKAIYLDLSPFGIEKELYLTRSDGTSLYVARDLAHHAYKMKEGRGLNIWGADHKLLSNQLAAALKILGVEPPEFIIHEFISLPQGGMSTRKGVFISADELLDETVEKAFIEVKKRRTDIDEEHAASIAEDVGVSAVRFNIEHIAPEKAMVFKWEEALDFERQGAPFIQYAYARALKILEKAPYQAKDIPRIPPLNPHEKKLIILISRFPDVVSDSAEARKASIAATYCIELANAFSSFYNSSKVIGTEEQDFRLALVDIFLKTLGNAMDLLGIKKLKEM